MSDGPSLEAIQSASTAELAAIVAAQQARLRENAAEGGTMPSERLRLEFPDGHREHHHPGTIRQVGDRLTRRGKEWVVIELHGRDDVKIVTLHHTSRDGNHSE